jgi:hypothetical protein
MKNKKMKNKRKSFGEMNEEQEKSSPRAKP